MRVNSIVGDLPGFELGSAPFSERDSKIYFDVVKSLLFRERAYVVFDWHSRMTSSIYWVVAILCPLIIQEALGDAALFAVYHRLHEYISWDAKKRNVLVSDLANDLLKKFHKFSQEIQVQSPKSSHCPQPSLKLPEMNLDDSPLLLSQNSDCKDKYRASKSASTRYRRLKISTSFASHKEKVGPTVFENRPALRGLKDILDFVREPALLIFLNTLYSDVRTNLELRGKISYLVSTWMDKSPELLAEAKLNQFNMFSCFYEVDEMVHNLSIALEKILKIYNSCSRSYSDLMEQVKIYMAVECNLIEKTRGQLKRIESLVQAQDLGSSQQVLKIMSYYKAAQTDAHDEYHACRGMMSTTMLKLQARNKCSFAKFWKSISTCKKLVLFAFSIIVIYGLLCVATHGLTLLMLPYISKGVLLSVGKTAAGFALDSAVTSGSILTLSTIFTVVATNIYSFFKSRRKPAADIVLADSSDLSTMSLM